jgi:membrane associated rhomboid family serine protease
MKAFHHSLSNSRFYCAAIFLGMIWALSILYFIGLLPDLFPKLLPRSLYGLPGIVTMPFLHANFLHLISNTFPFIVFSILISLRGNIYYLKVTVLITLIAGVLLWIFGRSAFHIGASGLVFGYFGFLLLRSIYSPSITSMAIAFGVFIFYGGMIWGVFPQAVHISWEGHLLGAIAGAITARLMKTDKDTS